MNAKCVSFCHGTVNVDDTGARFKNGVIASTRQKTMMIDLVHTFISHRWPS
jgi:hypothetical protein